MTYKQASDLRLKCAIGMMRCKDKDQLRHKRLSKIHSYLDAFCINRMKEPDWNKVRHLMWAVNR